MKMIIEVMRKMKKIKMKKIRTRKMKIKVIMIVIMMMIKEGWELQSHFWKDCQENQQDYIELN